MNSQENKTLRLVNTILGSLTVLLEGEMIVKNTDRNVHRPENTTEIRQLNALHYAGWRNQ